MVYRLNGFADAFQLQVAWDPQGWSRIRELAQQFDWKSLSEACSRPRFWATAL